MRAFALTPASAQHANDDDRRTCGQWPDAHRALGPIAGLAPFDTSGMTMGSEGILVWTELKTVTVGRHG